MKSQRFNVRSRHVTKFSLSTVVALLIAVLPPFASAQSITDALTGGSTSANFRLRYEDVQQDNAVDDATALTLRSSLLYSSESYNGFSATLGVEDVRIVGGMGDYTVGPTGFNLGSYSVIADPESTEVDQGFLNYSNGGFNTRVGRQVITLDNHRFVGNVGWRQDWQVYDAVKTDYTVNDKLKLSYTFLDKRHRIFADEADIDSKDHLFQAAYESSIGSLVAYSYLLENENAPSNSLDTYGIRLTGSGKLGAHDATYMAEYASQESEAVGAADFDASYFVLEGGLTFNGLTAKLGYESLGSDGGAYGFATPLATLHAFNGWADMFLGTPAQGLTDLYFNVSGKAGGGTWLAVYHDYDAEDSAPGLDDFGSEFNLQYAKPLGSNYTAGIKYANYSDGDLATKTDTQKLWIWFQISF